MIKIQFLFSAAACAFWLSGCQSTPQVLEPKLQGAGRIERVEVLRLLPGADVRQSLENWAKAGSVKAASIVSAVGSLKSAALRFSDQKDATLLKGPFEIVSLSGLVASSGVHLHASVSDSAGKTLGGHLAEGSIVYTTLELVIGVYRDVEFLRKQDDKTGYSELFIQHERFP